MELRCTAERETHLLSILRRELQLSSTLMRRLKYCGAYTVNGEPAHTDRPVRPGDVVRVCLDEPRPDYPAEDGPLSILYEDEALLAVDKPQGMLVHPSFSRQTGTLANRLLGYYDRTGQALRRPPGQQARPRHVRRGAAGKERPRPRSAHCSGEAQDLSCRRARCAAAAREGMIDVPIARLSPESLLRCVRADGQPARSAYRTLRTEHGISLLELQPLTGRTHQLRVHCAWLGCPILGDPQYGGAESGGPGQQLWRRFHPLLPPVFEKMAGNPVETGRFA